MIDIVFTSLIGVAGLVAICLTVWASLELYERFDGFFQWLAASVVLACYAAAAIGLVCFTFYRIGSVIEWVAGV